MAKLDTKNRYIGHRPYRPTARTTLCEVGYIGHTSNLIIFSVSSLPKM